MAKPTKLKIEPLILDSLLAIVRNAVGSRIFRTFIVRLGNRKQDLLKRGDLSCAFFASSVLALFRLTNRVHMTVDGMLQDMRRHGWRRIRRMRPGAILVWEEWNGHKHIGFYTGNRRAVSTSSAKRIVHRHHWTFGGKRKIVGIYWHKQFDAGP